MLQPPLESADAALSSGGELHDMRVQHAGDTLYYGFM